MHILKHGRARIARGVPGLALAALAITNVAAAPAPVAADSVQTPERSGAVYTHATSSSPIALNLAEGLIWSVNPDDNSVAILANDPSNYRLLGNLQVGREPQSVAVDPNGAYAYVANAADNTVSVIRIQNATWGGLTIFVERVLLTGAEPWAVVTSPDGNRVFVANSAQDTITVIDGNSRNVIGYVDLRNSLCNDPDRNRHFQPRGLAVTQDNSKLYVTRFLQYTKPGGQMANDNGKEGLVCQLNINTGSSNIGDYVPTTAIHLAPSDTGFKDANGNATSAYANQMQSIVIRGTSAYLPNIAASPSGPLKFNVDTQAYVNRIGNINTAGGQNDLGALNLQLGARLNAPRIFFANVWAMAFTNASGNGNAYVVSSGSDGLVKLNVDSGGTLSFTGGVSSTKFIDLNDRDNAATAGNNAAKNPLGIVINGTGTRAFTMNYVSRNVSIVDLTNDSVLKVVRTTNLPTPNTQEEQIQVGKEIFFSSRGNFDTPAGTTVSTKNRLSSEGWQGCASCHPSGLTDGEIWSFNAGPRKSVPLNATWNPHDRSNQRILNYSAIFDEVQDFEANIRNVSGPGALAGGAFDPNHGLIFSDTINTAPGVVNAFAVPNAGRPQFTVTLPGSGKAWPALDAMKEWVRFGVRTPNAPLSSSFIPSGRSPADIVRGRELFVAAGCQTCHAGSNFTVSRKDFAAPPAGTEISTETNPAPAAGTNPVTAQFLNRFLRNIGSFNLGVSGAGNPIGNNVGGVEKATDGKDALGRDYNGDGKGNGYNVPSLVGIYAMPPYYHNGACETLACVVSDVRHRTANNTRADMLADAADQSRLVAFLESLDASVVLSDHPRLP